MSEEKKDLFVRWFDNLGINDVPIVGGKNAALGEMYSNLKPLGVNIPDGFALTAEAYRHFFKKSGLDKKIKEILSDLDTKNMRNLSLRGERARTAILRADFPKDLEEVIVNSYAEFEKKYGKNISVAVRSSATAEDLPGASFAGQQETFLNVQGIREVLTASKKCIASLFTNRAISYRADKGFSHFDAALSVGIQVMVRSDKASSGVAFTLDTETGFDKVILINGVYGLGELIVQGQVIPDEFIVFKPALESGHRSIIHKKLGNKNIKLIYASSGIKKVEVDKSEQTKFSLTEDEVTKLAKWCLEIEKYFSKKHNRYQPMDIEWAKDGVTGELFIVQARPETIHSSKDKNVLVEYKLKERRNVLIKGIAVGSKIGAGEVRVLKDARNINDFKEGEVLVTEITDPDWEPIMKIASAIVTDKGGRTSHAAIVSRELGIPCIVGTSDATKKLKNGQEVTVCCSEGEEGVVFEKIIHFEKIEHKLDTIPKLGTDIMINIGSPDEAFKSWNLPAKGVGLGRLEFIIASHIKVHPNALINYEQLKVKRKTDKKIDELVSKIDTLTLGYESKKDFYVDNLARGIAKISAAMYPHKVIIRFSDFKTNEYRSLLGGDLYEPEEENPMLGWRGASRYYDPKFKEAFGLECEALKRVRYDMNMRNVIPMIPFCRTLEEGRKVLDVMKEHGLSKDHDGDFKTYMMCEIPSNILLAHEFLHLFDGMSVGSNDLTQLTLGLDRDSGVVAHVGNEMNEAVKILVSQIIKTCTERNKYIGFCGQAPSDHPEFAKFLIEQGIETMSLNPDTVIKTLTMLGEESNL